MNLEVKPHLEFSGIKKQVFQVKNSRRDGLILQLHHTVPAANGKVHRVRFMHVTFDEAGELLAASDHRGNIFIINLQSKKFWLLPNLGSCSVIAFPPTKKNEVLIGTVNCSLQLMNIEIGTLTGKLDGHTFPPKQITFSSNGRYCLTAAVQEAIVWDLDSNTQVHRLSLRKDVAVKWVQHDVMFRSD